MTTTIHPDRRLSRIAPLSRILRYDDFDEGQNGWVPLIGNYEHSRDSILPEYRDLRPPMLSNLTLWDTGTHGSMGGTYALKRHTFRQLSQIQLECHFTFKPEASTLRGEMDVRTALSQCAGLRTSCSLADKTADQSLGNDR